MNEFDVDKFADQIAQTRAKYVIFTMQQRTRFLIDPNATFDRLTGYALGEACSTDDLVSDLHHALQPHGIGLMFCSASACANSV